MALIYAEGFEAGPHAPPGPLPGPDYRSPYPGCLYPWPEATWSVTLTQLSMQEHKKARRYFRKHGGTCPLWGLGFDALFQPANPETRELLGWA